MVPLEDFRIITKIFLKYGENSKNLMANSEIDGYFFDDENIPELINIPKSKLKYCIVHNDESILCDKNFHDLKELIKKRGFYNN